MTTLDWNPSARKLREFAAVACFVLLVAATVTYRRQGGWLTVSLPLGVAAAVGVVAAIRPARLRLLYVLLMLATFPVGFAMSQLVLFAVFYGIITPLAALGRAVGSDPLDMRRRAPAPSYWRARRTGRSKASYLRQA